MDVNPDVSYTPYAASSREQIGDIITFTQFEERNLLSETQNLLSKTCEDAWSDKKSGGNSTIPPLISEEEMDEMSSVDESDDEPMSTEMLEDIHGCSQSHPSVNRIKVW